MSESSSCAPSDDRRVLDAGALKALAHPLRVRIFDLLSQRGPQTASSLAEELGESSGSTSYHLRALAKHDLIREVPGRGTAKERWWARPEGAIEIGAPDAADSPAAREASQIVVTETYRQRHQQLMRYLAHTWSDDGDDGDCAELSLSHARLTPEQFQTVRARLADIIRETVEANRGKEGPDVRPYLIRLDMFPVDTPTDRSQ